MKPKNKLKRKILLPDNYKTKDDFVRWSKKKHAVKKQTAEKLIANSSRDIAQALMVWADDGGSAGVGQPLVKTIRPSSTIKEKNHEQRKR